jgi:aspartyl-tRNA synthetase
MEFEESWLQHVLSVVAEKHGDEIQKLFGVNVVVPTLPFPKIPMGRAYEILTAMDHSFAGKEGDLDTAAEKLLSKHVMETHEHEFVFVTEYPVSVRPFYHMRFEDRPNITRSFDLLWNGLEITTGAQREHRYEILLRQAEEKGVDTGAIAPYLGFFKYGCPPHGGFGFGLSRMLMQLFKTNSVRDVTYVYRNTERLIP